MHRSQNTPKSTSRFVNPKPGAWAVRKSSTNRMSPFNKRETSQILKASSELGRASKSKVGVGKNTYEEAVSKMQSGFVLKRKSSKLLSTIKARLEKDSHVFNAKLKELEPTIKSLTRGEGAPKLKNSRTLSSRGKKSVTKIESVSEAPKLVERDQLGVGLLAPPTLEGEKLVTVGGYIISLQEANENITSVLRPRVSSDKNGLELEIKILGCNPLDIKFEKRYDTLIVIGLNKSTLQKLDESKRGPGPTSGIKDTKVKDISPFRSMTTRDFSSESTSAQYPLEQEYMEDVHEIINIFVPKHVSLNQILISKPDGKGLVYGAASFETKVILIDSP